MENWEISKNYSNTSMEHTTSVSNVLLSGVLPITLLLVLYSKYLVVLLYRYLYYRLHSHHNLFHFCNNSTIFVMCLSLYSNRLYIGITILRSCVMSTSVLLVVNMHDQNRALLLKISFFFLVLAYCLLQLLFLLQQYMHRYS